MPQNEKRENKQYDLEERTAVFSEHIISLIKEIKRDPLTLPILSQLIRSATSIGANYREANGASSRKDFTNKIYICKKEAKETQYWLRMLSGMVQEKIKDIATLMQEVKELTLIFSRIVTSARNKPLEK